MGRRECRIRRSPGAEAGRLMQPPALQPAGTELVHQRDLRFFRWPAVGRRDPQRRQPLGGLRLRRKAARQRSGGSIQGGHRSRVKRGPSRDDPPGRPRPGPRRRLAARTRWRLAAARTKVRVSGWQSHLKAGGAGLRLRGERLPSARKGGRAARAAKLSPLLPAMQNCTEVAVENGRCGQGDGAMAATRGPGVHKGSRQVPYNGVSTERRRRDDRERDAGAAAALSGAGDE